MTATVVALVAGLGVTVLSQTSASAAEETVFPDTTVPGTLVDPDRTSAELGLRFSVTVPGVVVGVRYYGTPQNTGTHTGSLWSSQRQRLATATFPASTGTGWQSVAFDTPVRVVPGRTYVASYLAPSGRYAADERALTRSSTRGHLNVPKDAGVYVYGRNGGFPRYTWKSSNYYVDVRFVADTTGTPTTSAPKPQDTQAAITTPSSTPSTTSPRPSSGATTTSPAPSGSATPSPGDTATGSPTPTQTPTSPTTTPASPTPTDPTLTGCAAAPSGCNYPDASTTGIEKGVTLKSVPDQVSSGPGWHYDSRGYIAVDKDGAVVSGISTTATLDVTANNVTIKNVRLNVTGETFGIALRHTTNVTIDHVEITAPEMNGPRRLMVGIKDIYGDAANTTIQNTDISRTSTGIQIDSGLIRDNYIHDMGYTNGDHVNGTTSNGGSNQLTIRHNTIFNQIDQTDAISLFQDFGRQANRLIEDNLVAGGGYTIYAGANAGNPTGATNIVVRNNRFSKKFFARGGYWGPATAYAANPGNEWTGNIWDDNGAGVSRP